MSRRRRVAVVSGLAIPGGLTQEEKGRAPPPGLREPADPRSETTILGRAPTQEEKGRGSEVRLWMLELLNGTIYQETREKMESEQVTTSSDEKSAVATLAAADMITGPDDEERDYEFDKLLTGRPEPVRFEDVGAFVHGLVIDKLVQQKRDFDTGDPKWNDDGSPALEPLVILKTEDGLVTLYLSSWRLAKEVGIAVRAAGQRRLQRGGTLAVRFVGWGEPYKKGAQPPKEYEAAYDPPGVVPGAAVSGEVNAPELGPPSRKYAAEVSVECLDGDCKGCDSRKCTHECHRASKPPAPVVTDSAPDEVPF